MSSKHSHTTLQREGPFDAFLADLNALGVMRVESGGEKFSVISARSNPRWWLIPLDHGGMCASVGLEMFQPVTRASKIVKSAMRIKARYAHTTIFNGRRVHLSGTPNFVDAFDQTDLCFAYFTGTAGPHRKTAIQIMTVSGNIVGYAKVSRNPLVKRYMENEAHFLTILSDLNLNSAAVPSLIDHRDETGIAWLVTDSLRAPGHVVTNQFQSAHRAFLAELAAKTLQQDGTATLAELTGTLKSLLPNISTEWATRIDAGILRLAPTVATLPVALTHGDFTPWNTFLVGDRLYVFDWEYAQLAYPLGYDQVHFTLAANLTTPAPSILDQLEVDIAACWFDGERASAKRALLFSLLLHAAFYLRRAVEAGDADRNWEEAERRAELIDVMLTRVEV